MINEMQRNKFFTSSAASLLVFFFFILHPPPYILKKDDPCYSKAALPQSRQTLLSEGILQVPIPFKNISHTLPVLLPILKRAVIKKDNRPIDQLSELRFN